MYLVLKRLNFRLNVFKCLTQLFHSPSLLKREPWLTKVDTLGFKDAPNGITYLQFEQWETQKINYNFSNFWWERSESMKLSGPETRWRLTGRALTPTGGNPFSKQSHLHTDNSSSRLPPPPGAAAFGREGCLTPSDSSLRGYQPVNQVPGEIK